MTRTREAREHLLALYRAGSATEAELVAAKAAYDLAATDEGVRAVTDGLGPLHPEQRHVLAVLLASTTPPAAAPNTSRPAA